jgi:hypothetical protein
VAASDRLYEEGGKSMIPQVEQNYYKDIRRIAKALEGIEKHLSTIAVASERKLVYNEQDYAVKPIWFDASDHEDDGK